MGVAARRLLVAAAALVVSTPALAAPPPPCKRAALRLSVAVADAAPGGVVFGLAVKNVSRKTCRVPRFPKAIRILAAGGNVLATTYERMPPSDPRREKRILKPNSTAAVGVIWRNWCRAAPRRPLRVRLVVRKGVARTVRSPRLKAPGCSDPATASTVGASPFGK